MTYTVAEELVVQLGHYGVKQIFGITGDALNAFTNAIRIHGEIEWFTVRHEETASFAASAQAEITGQLAVCAGTVGPGALHLVNGLYNAKRDRCPVLAITGQVPREEAHGPYFQETDINKAFDDICVFQATLQSAEQIPRLLQQAISAAVNQRGVAHIAVPTDIAVSKTTAAKPIYIKKADLGPLQDNELQQLANKINQAKSVSLLVGRGCLAAKQELAHFAEKINAPVARTAKGSEVMDFSHSHNIGGIGHVGTPHGLATLAQCDLLLMLGTDFPYSAFLPKDVDIIQVDINPEHLGRRIAITQGFAADVKDTLVRLLPLIKEKENSALSALQKKRDKWLTTTEEKYNSLDNNDIIHPQSVLLSLSELASDEAIFTADIGEVTVWLARYLKMRGSQRLVSSFNHGSLGAGLSSAIGVQALDRNRQVVSISGDGGFAMLLADLVTAARYELPITQIVLNNAKFGFVELEMEASGMPRYATDLVNPDFAMVAEACGWQGVTVSSPAELKSAIKESINTPKPVLLNVMVNPNELIIPSKIDPATAFKFMQGKIKEMVIEKDINVLFER